MYFSNPLDGSSLLPTSSGVGKLQSARQRSDTKARPCRSSHEGPKDPRNVSFSRGGLVLECRVSRVRV